MMLAGALVALVPSTRFRTLILGAFLLGRTMRFAFFVFLLLLRAGLVLALLNGGAGLAFVAIAIGFVEKLAHLLLVVVLVACQLEEFADLRRVDQMAIIDYVLKMIVFKTSNSD